ncbi:hypothetical protein MYCO108962_26395 [Mycobacterium colombiense]
MGQCDKRIGADHSPPGRRRRLVADLDRGHQRRLGAAPQRSAHRAARGRHVVRALVVAAGRPCTEPRGARPRGRVAADHADSCAVACRPAGRYLRDGRAAVGIVGRRDDASAAGNGARRVSRWGAGHPADRLRDGGQRIPADDGAHRHRHRGSRARRAARPACRLVAHRRLVHRQASGGAGGRDAGLGTRGGRRGRPGCGDQGRQGATARPAGRPELRIAALPESPVGACRSGSSYRVQLSGPARWRGRRVVRRRVAAQPEQSFAELRGRRAGASVAAHGGAQRRHHRHRGWPAPAGELDVGVLGADP